MIRELQWEHLALMQEEQDQIAVCVDDLNAALGAMAAQGDIAPFLDFHPLSEKEFAQGYCDLFLGASKNVANARFSWLLEFKYLQANARPAQIEAAFAEAEEQVERYASDKELLPVLLEHRELKAGMLVFVGTKKVLFRPWPPSPGAKPGRRSQRR